MLRQIKYLLPLGVALVSVEPAFAQSTSSLHLLAITSGHFGSLPNALSPATIPGAHLSGQLVLTRLAEHLGATTSTLVRSDEDRFVSKSDVLAALDRLSIAAEATPGPDVAIVYIIGHGYGEGFGWNYFLQPGDVSMPVVSGRDNINDIDLDSLTTQLIGVGEVVEALKSMGIRYVLLIDSCYEGQANETMQISAIVGEQVRRLFADVGDILTFMNQFHDPDPVVFATSAGSVVPTVPIPGADGVLATQRIGPLARRLLLWLDGMDTAQGATEHNLVAALTATDLDSDTEPAISFAEFGEPLLLLGGVPSADIQVVWGTADAADFSEFSMTAPEDEMPDVAPPEQVSHATLVFGGERGEWVSDGEDYRFDTADCGFLIDTWAPEEVSLTFCAPGGDWSVSLAVPHGQRFERRTYREVVRYPFHEGNESAFTLTGDGRGCNEIAGEFAVESVQYDGDEPTGLVVSFVQVCDGDDVALSGTLAVER